MTQNLVFTDSGLRRLASAILQAAGSSEQESETVAAYLVKANLVGHDSHGVIRVPQYVRQIREGSIRSNQEVTVVSDRGAVMLIEANLGFGQVVGEVAMEHGIERAGNFGISLVGIRNVGHLGRIGDWAELVANRQLVSLHFVNTLATPTVVPFGGRDGRLSTNPVAFGVPMDGAPPIVVDMATSVVAAGKLMVARNEGARVPEGWILDGDGKPTTDPSDFFEGGALLTFGGHKGYALSVVVDLFAGALIWGSSSTPDDDVERNNMLSILIDPAFFLDAEEFLGETRRFADWVKSSQPATPDGEVLLPGDVENRTKAERLANGIPLYDATFAEIVATANQLSISEERCRSLAEIAV